jgi:plasmid maintenance system antidote protein VapI
MTAQTNETALATIAPPADTSLQRAVAEELGVHINTVSAIVRGKTWRHVL